MKHRTLLILEQSDVKHPGKYQSEASEAITMAEIAIHPSGKVIKNRHDDYFQKSHTKTFWMRVRSAIKEFKNKTDY